MTTTRQCDASDIDPGDKSQVWLTILSDIDLLDRVAEINSLPIVAIPLVRQFRLYRIAANPEMKFAFFRNRQVKRRLGTGAGSKMRQPIAARKIGFHDLVVPPMLLHRVRAATLTFNPNCLLSRTPMRGNHDTKRQYHRMH